MLTSTIPKDAAHPAGDPVPSVDLPDSEVTRPGSDLRRLGYERHARDGRLTHYLFRFPAKFHPPIVRTLLLDYGVKQAPVLDPFCGSGTLLVEAAVLGFQSIGSDVDPLAVFVSRAKSTVLDPLRLTEYSVHLLDALSAHKRSDSEYERLAHIDLNESEAAEQLRPWILPAIPHINHWFRRYVSVDLARIRGAISQAQMPGRYRQFFLLCFASMIRNASNADPVPVSGLEFTAHMKRLDAAGRIINPISLFERSVRSGLRAMRDYVERVPAGAEVRVLRLDCTNLARSRLGASVSTVITSPPYHGAVDYYRRHQLEMFWLGLTRTQEDRLDLLRAYIGRPKVPRSHPYVTQRRLVTESAAALELAMRRLDPHRADAFKHYCVGMERALRGITRVLRVGGHAVLVVGNSCWAGEELPTADLLLELAPGNLKRVDTFRYGVKNRYMSYSRHNLASIDEEFVVVFRKDAAD